MLNAVVLAIPKIIMTHTGGNVGENVSGSTSNAMEPAQMKQLSVETICASVVMMIPTAGTPAPTTGSAMAPVYQSGLLVTKTALLDSITAITHIPLTTMTTITMMMTTATAMEDVSTKTFFLNISNIATTVSSVSGPMRSVPLRKASPVQRRTHPPSLHRQRLRPLPPPALWSQEGRDRENFISDQLQPQPFHRLDL